MHSIKRYGRCLKRWFLQVGLRPATQRTYEGAAPSYSRPLTDEERALLFGSPPSR